MEVLILGTRGVPAAHGGFETFAENLSLFLTARGHCVTVYCQDDERRMPPEDTWQGVRRFHIQGGRGPLGTVLFDLRSTLHSLRQPGVILTLGYNTAVFSVLYRLTSRATIMNMDGIEWKRDKWSRWERLWLRLNEVAGAVLSTHLVADHPRIAEHLEGLVSILKITMIPYCADPMDQSLCDRTALPSPLESRTLERLGLQSGQYGLVIARPEPENSLLEIVAAWSAHLRGRKLAVVGAYHPSLRPYHKRVMEAASPEVSFLGAIYDQTVVQTLRRNARVYLHGHRVGGTNPSLVEALAASNAVIAQENMFNRWVAGPRARYFLDGKSLSVDLDTLLDDEDHLQMMRHASHERHIESFLPSQTLESYEKLLFSFAVKASVDQEVGRSQAAARH